jgi:hypothetical protein
MRFSMSLLVVGLLVYFTNIVCLTGQQEHGDDSKKETAGRIAWQYDTGG